MRERPGGAWLSSIRVLKCLVWSVNECNPFRHVYHSSIEEWTWRIANPKLAESGIRSSRYAPYSLGYAYDTMIMTIRRFML